MAFQLEAGSRASGAAFLKRAELHDVGYMGSEPSRSVSTPTCDRRHDGGVKLNPAALAVPPAAAACFSRESNWPMPEPSGLSEDRRRAQGPRSSAAETYRVPRVAVRDRGSADRRSPTSLRAGQPARDRPSPRSRPRPAGRARNPYDRDRGLRYGRQGSGGDRPDNRGIVGRRPAASATQRPRKLSPLRGQALDVAQRSNGLRKIHHHRAGLGRPCGGDGIGSLNAASPAVRRYAGDGVGSERVRTSSSPARSHAPNRRRGRRDGGCGE